MKRDTFGKITGHTAWFTVTGKIKATAFVREGSRDCFVEKEITSQFTVNRTVLANNEDEAENLVLFGLNADDWEWVDGPIITRKEMPEDERLRLLGVPTLWDAMGIMDVAR